MEFKEFSTPEGYDYDIKSSLVNSNNNSSVNPYSEQLCDLIGILEDITEEELLEKYGISMNKYLHPTQETIDRVSEKLILTMDKSINNDFNGIKVMNIIDWLLIE